METAVILEDQPGADAEFPELPTDGTVEVEVGGVPFNDAPPRPCAHTTFGSSVVVAEILNVDGSFSHREARLRLRCMECGEPCEVETMGRLPADGGPGIVVKFRPQSALPSPLSQGEPHAG